MNAHDTILKLCREHGVAKVLHELRVIACNNMRDAGRDGHIYQDTKYWDDLMRMGDKILDAEGIAKRIFS